MSDLGKVEGALRAAGSRSVRRGGETYWSCPLHDDGDPSLAVADGDGGGVVFQCFPCGSRYPDHKAYVGALLDRLGLSWGDVSPPRPGSAQRRLVASYDYAREDGSYLFSVLRYDPKDFRQGVKVEGTGHVEWGLGGIRPRLFRLPQVVAALVAGEPVYVVEGEADVLALEAAGVTATCNPGGAGKWTSEYTAVFTAGAQVVVVPDWDPPDKAARGQQHGLAVVETLTAAGVQVEVRRAWSGKDARDHLAAGHTVAELVPVTVPQLRAAVSAGLSAERDERVRGKAEQLVDAADAHRLAAVLQAERAGYRVPVFEIRTPAEIAVPVPPLEFLIEGLWAAGSHGVVGGPKKSLKSFTADVLALSVATGKPAFGQFAPAEPAPVFLFVGEGGEEPRRARLQRLATDLFGCDLGDTELHLAAFAAPLDSDDFKRAVGRVQDQVSPAAIVLDSLYCFHPPGVAAGNLYERGPMLFGLSATVGHDTALVVVDHFNKTSSGVDLDRIAQAGMAQWADSWFLLEHRQDPDPSAGLFWLRGNVGSRQWGERGYGFDWDLGRFDPVSRSFATPVQVSCTEQTFTKADAAEHRQSRIVASVLDLLDREPDTHTKNDIEATVCELVSTGQKTFRAVWDELAADGLIDSRPGPHREGASTRTRPLWRRADGSGEVLRVGG